jgi:hypothetical protein
MGQRLSLAADNENVCHVIRMFTIGMAQGRDNLRFALEAHLQLRVCFGIKESNRT